MLYSKEHTETRKTTIKNNLKHKTTAILLPHLHPKSYRNGILECSLSSQATGVGVRGWTSSARLLGSFSSTCPKWFLLGLELLPILIHSLFTPHTTVCTELNGEQPGSRKAVLFVMSCASAPRLSRASPVPYTTYRWDELQAFTLRHYIDLHWASPGDCWRPCHLCGPAPCCL